MPGADGLGADDQLCVGSRNGKPGFSCRCLAREGFWATTSGISEALANATNGRAASRRRNMRSKLLCGLVGGQGGAGLSMGNWPKAPQKTPNGNGVPRQSGRLAAPTTEGRYLPKGQDTHVAG